MTVLPRAVTAAVVVSVTLLHSPTLGLAAALLVLGAIAAATTCRMRRADVGEGMPLAVLTLLPALALYDASSWEQRLLPADCERAALQLAGEVAGLPQQLDGGGRRVQRIDLRVHSVSPTSCEGPQLARLYIADAAETKPDSAMPATAFAPGDRLVLAARLRQPRGLVNPAASVGERDALLRGLHATGSARVLATGEPARSARARLDRWRAARSAWLRGVVDGQQGALLAALAVGDRRFIDDATWEGLRRFGITHLMVISGMHVSLVALPGWWLGSLLGRFVVGSIGVLFAPFLAVAAAGLYSVLAGLSLPTQRAVLMLALLCLPRILGRRAPLPSLLAAAVTLLLLVDPLAVLGASFWLSVGAVVLLAWLLPWRGEAGRVVHALRVQLWMVAAMLPLSLFWFGGGATVGAALNLLAIPLVSLLVVPGVLLAVLFAAVDTAIAGALARLAGQPLGALLWLIEGVEGAVPGAAYLDLRLPAPLLGLLLIAVLLGALPGIGRRWLLQAALVMPALAAPWLRPAGSDPAVEVVFFDVGQGTAVLARQGDRAVLYDTGPGIAGGPVAAERALLPALGLTGLNSLALLIVSHDDLDHAAGEERVAEAIPPRARWRGRVPQEDVGVRHDPSTAAATACRVGARRPIAPGLTLLSLNGALAGDDDNNTSCVILIEAFGYRFLLPGDIDTRRERDLVAYWGKTLRADVLLAAHHGSGSSNSRLWLRHVDARWFVVTAGHANRFGHPRADVVAAARARGARVLETARDGAIVFRIGPDGVLRCRRYRHRWAPFWRRGDGGRDCGSARAARQV